MSQRRAAFTMIELVFVIVIIGILSAVALPRFSATGEDAHYANVEHFVDLLNRSVGPMMWSGIQRNVPAAKGSVKDPAVSAIARYSKIFDPQTSSAADAADAQLVQIPVEITTNADGVTGRGTTHDIPLSGCANAGVTISAGVGRIASAKIGQTVYNIGCIDGSLSNAPHFFLDDGSQVVKK